MNLRTDGAMTDLPDFDLSRFTAYRLSVAAQKLSDELARMYRARFDLTVPEWRILAHLTQADGASVRDIETQVAMEKSKVSRAASRLEERGVIDKLTHSSDRRLVRLQLTPKGREMLAELLPQAMAFQQEIEATLGADLAGFERAIDALMARKP